ncbi:MAG: SpoIIIAH-like family protein [Oscillospiraceae bacterium]|jgi:stage III sporulation protein AH|nr:SpoIIIAH-like family protein [Oscillospiraceae bacterium]
MQIWKRNAVVAVIVLFVCVALYMSWSYGRIPEEDLPELDPVGSIGVEPIPADGPDGAKPEPAAINSTYFDEARLSRLEARDAAYAILTEALVSEEVSQEVRDNVSGEIEKMAQDALTEANIENTVIAKGYVECVAIIGQNGIKIVVAEPESGMTSADAAIITDVVLSESSIEAADISIVHVSL